MNTPPQGNLTTVARLRAVLEDTAAALAAGDLTRLLASETALQAVLSAQPWNKRITPEERDVVRRELEAAAAAMLRCRRLGASLSEFVRISLGARGEQLGYEPSRAAAVALTGRGFSQRV
jgi:hypothetical protein